jgi:hypothetical protein
MHVEFLIGVLGCLSVVAIYFWLVRQVRPEQA